VDNFIPLSMQLPRFMHVNPREVLVYGRGNYRVRMWLSSYLCRQDGRRGFSGSEITCFNFLLSVRRL